MQPCFDVVQGVREGVANQGKYHALMRNLLADVKARAAAGELLDSSVAGHLLRLRYAAFLTFLLAQQHHYPEFSLFACQSTQIITDDMGTVSAYRQLLSCQMTHIKFIRNDPLVAGIPRRGSSYRMSCCCQR